MKLHYLPEGDPNATQQWLPGQPASDHDEADEELAAEKLQSGLYEEAQPARLPAPPRPPAAPAEE